jgi:copper chaperone NosL
MTRRTAARLLAAVTPAIAFGADPVPPLPKPGAMDLCPVCGMLVSKYPQWIATVLWKDGQAHHFDGAKDLFLFLQALPKYAPRRKRDEIRFLAVTDFYDLKKMDARQAVFVAGSDVLGPMGHDLIPLATPADAEEFSRDHKGKRTFRFDEITPAVVARVDEGRF